MVTRQERIDDFIHEASPRTDQPLQVLCEGHVGTYVIPFLCRVAQRHMGKRKDEQTHRSYRGGLTCANQR